MPNEYRRASQEWGNTIRHANYALLMPPDWRSNPALPSPAEVAAAEVAAVDAEPAASSQVAQPADTTTTDITINAALRFETGLPNCSCRSPSIVIVESVMCVVV